MPTIYFRGTRADVRRIIQQAIRIATATGQDTLGVRQAVQYRMGNALLSKVQQAFVVKSRGGTDECGIKWKPLAPSTLAARRRKAGLPSERQLRAKMEAARKRKAKANSREAIRRATTTITNLYDKLGKLSAGVDILRDTGLMLRSFSPGVEDGTSAAAFQVIKAEPGLIIIGTNRYPWHHTGSKKTNLPARNLWPVDGRLPETWWMAIRGAGVRGFAAVLALALSGGQRPAV